MADDLATMKARTLAELSRPDLVTQVAAAITSAIAVYSKQRFRFSDISPLTPPTFTTVIGQPYYTSAANANIGSALRIDYVNINIGNTVQYLERVAPDDIKLYNQIGTMMGQPTWYAYEGNTLMFSPVPSDTYLITLGLFRNVAAPVTDDEVGNPWMTDGERLIRARAKYEVATHVTRNDKMREAMSPDPPAENNGKVGAAWREWKSLKGEAARITGRGIIRSMRF